MTLDQFLARRRRGIDALTDAQIGKMRQLIAVTSEDDPQKPDFWFRLGELYADKRQGAFEAARALDEPIHAASPTRRGVG